MNQLEEGERINNELKQLKLWCLDQDGLEFEDEEMTSVLPVLVVKEEFRNILGGVVVRADVQLFMNQVSNALAKASHPHHSGGCTHLFDDIDRYRERVGNDKATLPKATSRQCMPDKLVMTSTVEWKLRTNEESIRT